MLTSGGIRPPVAGVTYIGTWTSTTEAVAEKFGGCWRDTRCRPPARRRRAARAAAGAAGRTSGSPTAWAAPAGQWWGQWRGRWRDSGHDSHAGSRPSISASARSCGAEVLTQPGAGRLGHRRARARVPAVEAGGQHLRESQEVQHRAVRRLGLLEERLAVEDVDPVRGVVATHAGELLGVLAAVQVAVVPVAEAAVPVVGEHPVALAVQPLVLEVERPLERLGLEPARELVLVGREGPLDGVAQHRQDAYLGQVPRHPLGRTRVEQVVAAGLERDRLARDGPAARAQVRAWSGSAPGTRRSRGSS